MLLIFVRRLWHPSPQSFYSAGPNSSAMRCLVTGGTGFIGSNIALELKKQGHDVLITGTNYEQKLTEFAGKILQPSFIGLDWDRIGKVDVLFHQSGITDNQFKDEKEVFRANVESTRKLFEYVLSKGCRRIVYASSTAVYGMRTEKTAFKESDPVNPNNAYARSKVAIEKLAKEFQEKYPDAVFVGLRYCNVYGPRENHKGKLSTMIYQFAQQMIKGNPKMFKWGDQERDYLYVKDAVKANLLGSQAKISCVVNCGSGTPVSFKRLVELLNKVLGLNREPQFIDNPYEGNYQDFTQCDLQLAKEKIGYEPDYDIEKGIEDYHKSGWLKP